MGRDAGVARSSAEVGRCWRCSRRHHKQGSAALLMLLWLGQLSRGYRRKALRVGRGARQRGVKRIA